MFFKKLKKILAVVLITYVLIELVCFIFIEIKFKAAHFPTFSFQYNYTEYDFPIAEINTTWGTWHYQERYTEKKQCFESVYYINSVGARDQERAIHSDSNRIIFLGDSFIEGYGLQQDERLTNLLEKSIKREVLNFACGYFTPTQEYLIYKNLAKNFTHNTIVIGILPFNDLKEDDTSFNEQDKFIHYQPYFQGVYPHYDLMYREDHLSKSTFNKQGYFALQNTTGERAKRFLKEFSFWYNIFRFIKSNKPVMDAEEKPFSGYYDCSRQQMNKLFYILEKLKETAPAKRIIIIGIPVYNDFIRFKENPLPVFSTSIDSFCRTRQIEYIDLLPLLITKVSDPKLLFFSCDGHWNVQANKLAAEIILPLLQQ